VVNGLAEAGLIDEYQLFVHPIIVGRGKRLFDHGLKPTLFALAETKTFGTGIIALTYRYKGKAALG
jgi:dihydrofolate reductase